LLQLYNKNKEKIKGLRNYKDYCIESVLSTGDRTLSFLYPAKLSDGIEEESYIINKTNEFVIKEIQDSGEYKSIKAVLNVENLEGKVWDRFISTEQTISDCLALALAGTGWLVGTCNVDKKRTIVKTYSNTWEIIQEAQKTYRVELEFDTLNKKINVNDRVGTDKGCYFIDSLNLKALDVQSNSYGYYTRIIARGKDDLLLADPGYLENYQYSNKIKTLYWKDERYTDLESLTEDATAKLEEMSKPYRSYTATVLDLANMNETYKDILSYSIGDVITLISKEKSIKEKQRIVKITEYPDEPTRNKCEISNTKLSFDDIQKEQQQTTETVNNITSDNGTISESAISVAVSHLVADKADIQDLNVISARIGTLEVNGATIDQLNATNANIVNLLSSVATIGSALINKANIADLNATNASISNLDATVANIQTLIGGNLTMANMQSLVLTSSKVTVDNGFIKNAMIESLDVTKINAGTLNTNKISVSSSDGGLIIAGATQQFKDSGGNVRLQLGQDATGNFSFILRAADGTTTLIDGYGIKANAIADKLIKTNMVADSAIGSGQINYSSFVTGMNAATNTSYIKASKVSIDLTGQTMDIAFNNLSTTVDGVKTTTNTNTTSISTIQGQITTLISNTTITTNGTTTQLKDAYNSTVATVNSFATTIGQHTSQIDTANSNITSVTSKEAALEITVNSINATLTSTSSTVATHTTQISTANSNIATLNTNVSTVTSRVTAVELTASGLSTRVGATETTLTNLQIGGRNLLLNSNFSNGTTSWGASNGSALASLTTAPDSTTFPAGVTTCAKNTVATSQTNGYIDQTLTLLSNTKYTISLWVYIPSSTTGTASISVWYNNNGWQAIGSLTIGDRGQWVKKSYTFTTNATYTSTVIGFGLGSTSAGNCTYSALFKLEVGNQATDWTPSPEDINSAIASLNSSLTTTINSNVSTINQTTNAISANVTSLQSSVSTINTTLAGKADTTTVTAISNRTATLETSVTGINASITTLNSNVSSVTTTANSALNSINNLQVGGRNLLLNTSLTSMTSWYIESHFTLANGVMSAISDGTTNDFGQYVTMLPNTTYTLSVKAKATSPLTNTKIMLYYYTTSWISTTTPTLTTNYAIYSFTFTTPSTGAVRIEFDFKEATGSGTVYLKEPKLELGNKATDWTPAPEDTTSQITTINTSVSSLQSSVSVLQSQISLKVEQTQINTAVATLNGQITATNSTISSLQSSINLQLSSITSSVSKTVSTKNLINNPAFNNALGDYFATNTITACDVLSSATYTSWGYAKSSICDKALRIRYDMTGDNYVEFKNLYAKVKPSTTYTLSYYYILIGEYTAPSSFIYERTAAQWNQNTYSNPIIIGPDAITGQNTWVRYTKTFTTQSTTDSIMLRFGFHQTHASYECEMLITAIQLEEGSSATDWVNSATSVVGTSITQSPVDVMTAFNNISSYFQVSADGAKFGNLSSGAYTKMSASGLEHIDSTGSVPYHYISYLGQTSVSMGGTTSKSITINFPNDIVTKLNGTIPKGIASVSFYDIGTDQTTSCVGCSVTNITATTITLTAYLVSPKFTTYTSSSGGVYPTYTTTIYNTTGSCQGSVSISYLIIG